MGRKRSIASREKNVSFFNSSLPGGKPPDTPAKRSELYSAMRQRAYSRSPRERYYSSRLLNTDFPPTANFSQLTIPIFPFPHRLVPDYTCIIEIELELWVAHTAWLISLFDCLLPVSEFRRTVFAIVGAASRQMKFPVFHISMVKGVGM